MELYCVDLDYMSPATKEKSAKGLIFQGEFYGLWMMVRYIYGSWLYKHH